MNREIPTSAGLLWIDAVGGFLVLADDEVTIGQAIPETSVDVAIQGDVSRRHAMIRRHQDEYVLHPLGPVAVAGSRLEGPALLCDGHEIVLGASVRMMFRQPHPYSNTARLDLTSHHRTQPAADGILLVGETCVLGPDDDCHVVCRGWEGPLVLMPAVDGRWRFQAGSSVMIEESELCSAGELDWGMRLSGEHFALMMERL